ncbi:MAG: 30S ribosomal protein S5 [Patescibacteria group bacterium]|nr:30S ribosomal protein S5 [Patescibacteria group bacterium]
MATEENKNQKGGPRGKRRFFKRDKPDFEQKLLDLARVTRVVKGGRRFSFRAAMVIGNRKGKVGFGVAKGSDVSNAIGKAVANAKKRMLVVKRTNTTIGFDVRKKVGAAKVLIKPAKEGRGIVAGGAMRAVLELAGVKDVVAKSLGTSSKINVARATLVALEELNMKMVKEKEVRVVDKKVEKKEDKNDEEKGDEKKIESQKKENK